MILTARKRLEEERFAQVGSSAIKWELHKLGASFPSDRTINRILNREGLTTKQSYVPKGIEYPYFTEPAGINNIHQADLVGPRYAKGDGRFYSFNVIDIFSHRVYVESQRTKEDDRVAASTSKGLDRVVEELCRAIRPSATAHGGVALSASVPSRRASF